MKQSTACSWHPKNENRIFDGQIDVFRVTGSTLFEEQSIFQESRQRDLRQDQPLVRKFCLFKSLVKNSIALHEQRIAVIIQAGDTCRPGQKVVCFSVPGSSSSKLGQTVEKEDRTAVELPVSPESAQTGHTSSAEPSKAFSSWLARD